MYMYIYIHMYIHTYIYIHTGTYLHSVYVYIDSNEIWAFFIYMLCICHIVLHICV